MKKPHYIDVPYDDPAKLFAPFANKPFAQFLDSSMFDHEQGRYSFIALDPFETFTQAQGAFDALKTRLQELQCHTHEDMPPFQGGVLGYFSYELLHETEKLTRKEKDEFATPDICLGFYDVVAAFDHIKKQAWIFSHTTVERAHWLQNMLYETSKTTPPFKPTTLNWQSDFTKEAYLDGVQKVIDYIKAGDIFQANFTQRFRADLPQNFNIFSLYQNLRKNNPAPFSAFLNFKDFCIASSSPERFLKLENNHVETRPIKGTRPRDNDPGQDLRNAQELSNSEKDMAENTMIVDLLRNDISKVCKPHSVDVPKLCEVQSFASVHHLVSTVVGELDGQQTAIDLLQGCFPGGSITGAPKVRAMEIISELEPCPRGVYCGAIGYIGFDGTMDTNIVIRTLVFKKGQVCVQVGGGIVADSQPENEYDETLDKAKALFDAFEQK